uniref:Transmembrane protein n=1 Tax=Schistosoma curassoni TaxID=6186 RepID=A0A183L1N6_9TREM
LWQSKIRDSCVSIIFIHTVYLIFILIIITTTANISYSHFPRTYNTSKKNTPIEELSTNDLANYLTKLNDLLSSFQLAIDFQIQHMHSDLLASTYTLFSWYDSKRLNEKTTDDKFELLQSSLFNNAICFLSLLTRNPNISKIEESAILQSVNLIIFLWDHNQSTTLFTRLTDTGVLNNIFILLTECTKGVNDIAYTKDSTHNKYIAG